MRGNKYLSEIMESINLSKEKNNLILAPIGSGKTFYILNKLREDKKILYLCDNNNLKRQTLTEDNTYEFDEHTNFRPLKGVGQTKAYVSTYKEFGSKIEFDFNEEWIKQNKFDLIVADEIHSLIEYYSFSKDAHLSSAIRYLMTLHDVPIIMFTATEHYLHKLCLENKQLSDCFEVINLLDNKNIRRYTERRKSYINNLSQMRLILDLKEYANGFNYMGMKCLIYTRSIKDMQEIEGICKSIKGVSLRPICIWSVCNKDNPMNTEQLLVRECLIKKSILLDPYNVLIINKASETGLNIKDEDMELAIINSTNITEQAQARGRIRKDIDMICVRTDDRKLPSMKITIEDEYLDKLIHKDEMSRLIESYNLRDANGRIIGIRAFSNKLNYSGYIFKSQCKQIDGKRDTYYTMSIK